MGYRVGVERDNDRVSQEESTYWVEYTTRWLTWQVLSLKLGLSTNNNLLDLAQLSGRAVYYLELKYGQEYATMELTKNKQIRADSTVAFRVAHQPKH